MSTTQHLRRDPPREAPGQHRPEDADFDAQAIRNAVFKRIFNNPANVWLTWSGGAILAGGVVFTAWPVFAIGGLLAAAGVGRGIWQWNTKLEEYTVEHVEGLRRLRADVHVRDLREIETACKTADFEDGAKEAHELNEAFERLRTELRDVLAEGQNMSAQCFLNLAEDAYREGLGVLRQALRKYDIVRETDIDLLRSELDAWEQELQNLGDDASIAKRKSLEMRIADHKNRVQRFERCSEQIDQLLAESNSLEASLHATRDEVVNLDRREFARLDSTGAAKRLRTRVEAARRVEERLSGLGRTDTTEDQEYMALGETE